VEPLILWHGSQNWQGPPQLQRAGKGKSEYGSGLYLTTSASTARKYAKGGGSILRFEIDPDLTTTDDAEIGVKDAVDFLSSIPRLRNKKKIADDILLNAQRRGKDSVHAFVIENLMSHHGALKGVAGPMLAEWYVKNGIDAAVVHHADEDWLVLYNLDKILSYKKTGSSDVQDVDRIRTRRMRELAARLSEGS